MRAQHFYMVYLKGGGAPSFRHATLDGAEREAKRLATQHGEKAFVLCSLKSFERAEFKVEDCSPPEQPLPF